MSPIAVLICTPHFDDERSLLLLLLSPTRISCYDDTRLETQSRPDLLDTTAVCSR